MKPPLVSVLVPTYNYARFLPEAIASVLAQNFRDFELIIIDDRSTDNTAAIVEPFCRQDDRVHFSINSINLGMVKNWNHCLHQARGEYIKFLFGDDRLCHPDALGRMLALLQRYPSATLAASARVIMDEQSCVLDVWRDLPDGCHKGEDVIRAVLWENGKNLVGEPSAVMFRKTDAARGFDPSYQQLTDIEMWFHLLGKGDLAYTREPLCAFRCHPLQQTERNTASGVGWTEHAHFMAEHAVQPKYPRALIWPILRHLRRAQHKNTVASSPQMIEWQRRLIERAGPGWRWPYGLYDLRCRVGKPLHHWVHSVQKRLFRRQFKPWTADLSGPGSNAQSGSSNAGGTPA